MRIPTNAEQEEVHLKFRRIGSVKLYLDDLESLDKFLRDKSTKVEWWAGLGRYTDSKGEKQKGERFILDDIKELKELKWRDRNNIRIYTTNPNIEVHFSTWQASVRTRKYGLDASKLVDECHSRISHKKRIIPLFFSFHFSFVLMMILSTLLSLMLIYSGGEVQSHAHLRNLFTIPLMAFTVPYGAAVISNLTFGRSAVRAKRRDERVSKIVLTTLITLIITSVYDKILSAIENLTDALFAHFRPRERH